MKAITHPVAFNNDYDDRVMRSGNGQGSEPRKSVVNTYEPGENDSGERVGLWQPTDKRQKPLYNPAAGLATQAAVNAQTTRDLVAKAPAVNEAVVNATLLGKPNGYMRSDEVIEETDSYRVTRASDGTIRTDLIGPKA